MPPHSTVDRQVLEIIIRSPGTAFDEVVLQCHDLTWNQVFLTIDRLSREGVLRLTPSGGGHYALQLCEEVQHEVLEHTAH
jgi:hypothetical protein